MRKLSHKDSNNKTSTNTYKFVEVLFLLFFYIGIQKIHAPTFIFKNYCQTINLFKKLLCGLKKKLSYKYPSKKINSTKKILFKNIISKIKINYEKAIISNFINH